MKTHYYIITLVALSLACAGVNAQSSNQNYILTRTMTNDAGTNSMNEIQYFDGLGRPIQTVRKNFGPQGQDIVDYLEYDEYGRESKNYLPVVLSAGNFGYFVPLSNIKNLSTQVYQNDTKAYSQTVYEASPLNRVVREYGPGQAWNPNSGTGGKPVAIGYMTNNTTTDYLRCINYSVSGNSLVKSSSNSGYYATGQLYVTKTTDEDSNESYEFKDKLGQVLLTRQIDKTKTGTARLHDTYYVYDDLGHLRFILPPLTVDKMTGTSWDETNQTLKDYAYIYKYNKRGLCIEEKIPGCEPVYLVYDKADHLVLRQDGEQRAKSPKEWTMNIYDNFDRLVISGIYTTSIPESVIRNNVFAGTELTTSPGNGPYGYDYTGNIEVLLVNYYDDYDRLFSSQVNFPSSLNWENKSGYGTRYVNGTVSAKGLLVGTRVRMLDSRTEILTAMYYDNKNRVVQTKSINHLGGLDREYVKYDFTGNPVDRLINHGTGSIEERYRYEYDHAGRPTKTYHRIGAQSEILLSEQTYDQLGRLTNKKLHNTENITYTYNIRNWLKEINSPRFRETLFYQDAPSGATARYNGNISAMTWKVQQESYSRRYKFSYDGLNRLTGSVYGQDYYGSFADNNYFNESMTYDKHGNILTLSRYMKPVSGISSTGLVNSLTYSYLGNQVKRINDGAPPGNTLPYGSQIFRKAHSYRFEEYIYNANGCMTVDYNKGIAKIEYNSLNLPKKMQFMQGHILEYSYDALGVKRREFSLSAVPGITIPMGEFTPVSMTPYPSQLDYCGNVVYGGSGGYVERVHTAEGYLRRSGVVSGNWEYYYTLKDHLGSARSEFKVNGTTVTNVGYTHYYPSGIEMTDLGVSSQSLQNRERFNNKELLTAHGLNMLDYGARLYDGARGQWMTPDPLAEMYYSISPYAYCANNPIKYVDPDGRKFIYAQGSSQTFRHQASTTIHYMNKKGTGGIIKQIQNHSKTITLKETSGNSNFDPKTNTLNWNSKMGVLTDEGVIMSPATVLNHEADHALQEIENPNQKATDKNTSDKDYNNKEEKRVITGSEQETAKKHGEIKKGEVTRKNHGGQRYDTKSPTTTDAENEVIVTP